MTDQMEQFYKENTNFKIFVDKVALQYGRTISEVLQLATTKEVYKSYRRGGCNAGDK